MFFAPRPQPVYYNNDNNGGCFGFLAIFIVIAILAIAIGYYILLFFIGLGLLVGGVFALVIYIRALSDAIKMMAARGIGSNKLMGVIGAILKLMLDVTVCSVRETMTVVSNCFNKFLNYRVLSFQKWMWLTVTLTVMACEVIFVVWVTMFELALIAAIITLILHVIAIILAGCTLVALCYTAVLAFKDMIGNIANYTRMDHFVFSSASSYGALVRSFLSLFRAQWNYIKGECSDTAARAQGFFALSGINKIFSFQKWFYIAAGITVALVALTYSLIHLVLYTVAFLCVWIANLFWTTGATIVRCFRRP